MGFQRMNKKGLNFKNSFYAIILVGFLAAAVGTLVNSYSNFYGTGISSETDNFNKIDDVSSISRSNRDKLSASDPVTGLDAEANTFRGVYGILTNIYNSYNVIYGEEGLIRDISYRFGIPAYVTNGIIVMMFAAIGFTLVAIIFRLGKETA